jgi:hypothetical protein
MYHQRRERDLNGEITTLRTENATLVYNLDKSRFYTARLADNVRSLMEEVVELGKQRDSIMIEKARLLNPGFIKFQQENTKQQSSNDNEPENALAVVGAKSADADEQGNDLDTITERPTSADKELRALVQGYQLSIAQLRIRLSEAEDKLAWQKEAMAKLGKKATKPTNAWGEDNMKALGLPTAPKSKNITNIKSMTDSEIRYEKLLMNGLRENLEIKAFLNSDDTNVTEDGKGFLSLSKLVHVLIRTLGCSLPTRCSTRLFRKMQLEISKSTMLI